MLLGFFLSSFLLLPLAQGAVIPVFPQTLVSIPSDCCGNPQTKTTSGTAGSLPGHGAKPETEPAKGREKKKDGLRKNMPFGKRQIEMFKGRWQGERKEENRAASSNCWDQSLWGEGKRHSLPSLCLRCKSGSLEMHRKKPP